jgi:AraC family transcriptional regulator
MTTSYKDRLGRVCDYIYENLDNDLSLENLSKIMGISKYHFHRVFAINTGINLFAFIQLLRFKRASYQLTYNKELKIIDIALDAKFESHEAFSRAFKKTFGVTPTEFRNEPDWQKWHDVYQFKSMTGEKKMEVKIINFKETSIAVLEYKGSPQLLNNSIPKFINWRKTSGQSPVSTCRSFGLVYNDPNNTPPEDFRFDICGELTSKLIENSQGIIAKVIPEGRCAVIRHIGSRDKMDDSIYYLYKDWLLKNNEELRDFPLFFQYHNFFPETVESELVTDIFLPIK